MDCDREKFTIGKGRTWPKKTLHGSPLGGGEHIYIYIILYYIIFHSKNAILVQLHTYLILPMYIWYLHKPNLLVFVIYIYICSRSWVPPPAMVMVMTHPPPPPCGMVGAVLPVLFSVYLLLCWCIIHVKGECLITILNDRRWCVTFNDVVTFNSTDPVRSIELCSTE